jgi:hypothetical protein
MTNTEDNLRKEKTIEKEINIGIDYANPNRVWKGAGDLIDLKVKQAKAETMKKVFEDELRFLKNWNADDLIKQAETERSHFYVGSRARMIKQRIKELTQKIKGDENEE